MRFHPNIRPDIFFTLDFTPYKQHPNFEKCFLPMRKQCMGCLTCKSECHFILFKCFIDKEKILGPMFYMKEVFISMQPQTGVFTCGLWQWVVVWFSKITLQKQFTVSYYVSKSLTRACHIAKSTLQYLLGVI